MARKRDQIPPFEIMRRSTLARQGKTQPSRERDRAAEDESAQSPDAAATETAAKREPADEPQARSERRYEAPEPSSWVDRAMIQGRQWLAGGAPIMIRLPRGMALVLVAAVLVLVLLAYFAGHSRGFSAGETATQERFAALDRAAARGMPALGGIIGANGADANGDGRVYLPGDADPRQPGLNYLITALYPLEEAQELARFIARTGVDVLVVPADNAGRFHVIPLVGYDKAQLRAREHLAFDQAIGRLGREWLNRGKGDDLSMRYWALHQSP